MWGWSKNADSSRASLESERAKLGATVQFLETKREDADTAYRRGLERGVPRSRLRTLLESRNSYDRRIQTASRLQNKASVSIGSIFYGKGLFPLFVISYFGGICVGFDIVGKLVCWKRD